jgi:hypothetical protein
MNVIKLLFFSFIFCFSMLKCDIIGLNILENRSNLRNQLIFLYHDKHEKTSKSDEQFKCFKQAMESSDAIILLEDPGVDEFSEKLMSKMLKFSGRNIDEVQGNKGVLVNLIKDDFVSKKTESVDSLRCSYLTECLMILLAETFMGEESFWEELQQDNPKFQAQEEIKKEIDYSLSEETMSKQSKRWDEALSELEQLMKSVESKQKWLKKVKDGIEKLKIVLKEIYINKHEIEKSLAYRFIYLLKLAKETRGMRDSDYGWSDGVEVEVLIKILKNSFLRKIVVIAGAHHSSKLNTLLQSEGFELMLSKFPKTNEKPGNSEQGEEGQEFETIDSEDCFLFSEQSKVHLGAKLDC